MSASRRAVSVTRAGRRIREEEEQEKEKEEGGSTATAFRCLPERDDAVQRGLR